MEPQGIGRKGGREGGREVERVGGREGGGRMDEWDQHLASSPGFHALCCGKPGSLTHVHDVRVDVRYR